MEMPYLCPSFISRCLGTTERERKRSFLQNGNFLLKELIASSDGKYNAFRSYSEKELKIATNNYDRSYIFNCKSGEQWYKGTIEGRPVSIHKLRRRFPYTDEWSEMLVNKGCNKAAIDVSISAMLSGHKNVLKLLGCCLETIVPTIVYEYVGDETLSDRIHTTTGSDSQPLPWKSRLEIAGKIAHAIAYLHTAFAKPIIHRETKPANIWLDQNYVPKLSHFSSSVIIREGETIKVDSFGSCAGYATADRFEVNEKIDVCNFGSLILELLTGKDPRELHDLVKGKDSWECGSMVHFACLASHVKDYLSCHSIEDIVDSTFFIAEGAGESPQQQLHQWEAVKELALKCMATPKEERPTMVEVTKQLWQIELS